ncbi:MAG: single-stranded-DNA-specific exonuclease RecJ [Nitrospirae bacterium]|nr:single-stranded-DNA-specific exonuclease RecJ [Nitrospirota bacterium]
MEKRWFIPRINHGLAKSLSDGTSLSFILSQILINRRIETPEEAMSFLSPSLDNLLDPFLMNDMEKAAIRIKAAIENREKILIYGDYDVDGITGTALLLSILSRLNANVTYYIPHRLKEGYGLNVETIKRLKTQDSGLKLIVTVDCGTSSFEEVNLAKSLGIDVIITDHHIPPATHRLPEAYAILNPNREDSAYPFRDLAGVGVVFKLCQALTSDFRLQTPDSRLLDLVALGTIADIVSLTGENRILVKAGLETLTREERTGIKILKKVSGFEGRSVSSGIVSFCLAPRINAAGRIGDAGLGVRLLLTQSESEAFEISETLDRLNRERQEIEEKILHEALEKLGIPRPESIKTRGYQFPNHDYSIILASPEWHIGVLGIVASRLTELFYRPAFLFCLKDNIAKGSARSIPNFHLHEGLTECSDLLSSFGGHEFAAGLSMKEDNLENFRMKINEIIKNRLGEEDLIPRLRIDAKVDFRDINFNLINELGSLSPFGLGNPEPVLGAKTVEVLYPRIVGDNHLKVKLRQDRAVLDGIGFDMGSLLNGEGVKIREGEKIDIAFTPSINEWEGGKTLQLEIKAIRPHK